jgi:hypothetical protein
MFYKANDEENSNKQMSYKICQRYYYYYVDLKKCDANV